MYHYTALVTLLAALFYLYTSTQVSRARIKYGVKLPAIAGNADFERVFRIQMNTLEWLPIFLPSLWLFAGAWGDLLAAAIGIFWPIGRLIYARGYYMAAEKRGPGFGISFFSAAILLLGTIVGLVMNFI